MLKFGQSAIRVGVGTEAMPAAALVPRRRALLALLPSDAQIISSLTLPAAPERPAPNQTGSPPPGGVARRSTALVTFGHSRDLKL
jgi:hypothetical protein